MKRSIATGIAIVIAAGIGVIAGAILGSSAKAPKAGAGAQAPSSTTASAKAKRRILYWWDPMIGPSSISPKPGISAMGMKLVPVYAGEGATRPGEVTINPAIQQDLAVETTPVRVGALHKTVRTVGYFRQATPRTYVVSLRVSGWIGSLYATTDGTVIRKGDPLFTLYSPQLLAAQEELLAARQNAGLAVRTHDPRAIAQARRMVESLRRRLLYLGVDAAELGRIIARGKAQEYLTFHSPVSGYLSRVSLRQQSFVRDGRPVMRIEQLSTVWLDAKVYDNQLPWLRRGELMQAHVAADPGRTLEGRIFFIDPNEDPRTHTVTVRARFANPDGLLRPGSYALVDVITTPKKGVVLAPASAIIHTGTEEVALLAEGHGRFLPRKVTTGLTGGGLVQVLSGLEPGQQVVTSGQFLIDVESNMNELTTKLTAGKGAGKPALPPGGKHGAMPGMKMPPATGPRMKAADSKVPRARTPEPANGRG